MENLLSFIRDIVKDSGAQGVVVGLSGGIDSSVVAALAARALGSENVLGITIPCGSHEDDLRLADLSAECAGISGVVRIDLTGLHRALLGILPGVGQFALPTANLKSRLRMLVLYAYANAGNMLVAGTGNRTELLLGYFTKYGDGAVDFEPIGGLLKREVWKLAAELGVPQEIIDRPPSAGLWAGQTDEDEIGYSYDELDAAVEAVEDGIPVAVDAEVYERVAKMKKLSAHKRRMPPCGPRGLE